jgi:hypothetical protein
VWCKLKVWKDQILPETSEIRVQLEHWPPVSGTQSSDTDVTRTLGVTNSRLACPSHLADLTVWQGLMILTFRAIDASILRSQFKCNSE